MCDSTYDRKGLVIFLIVTVTILLLTVSCRLVAQEGDFVFHSEAENLNYEGLELLSDSSAEGNLFLRMNDSGYVKWYYDAPQSGYYTLKINYRTIGGSKEEYLNVNEKQIPIGFAYSESWQTFSQDIYLENEGNILRLLPSWGNIDIDYITISNTKVIPSIKPKTNYFYKNLQRELNYFISNYKKEIKFVTLNGMQIDFEVNPFPFKEESVFLSIMHEDLKQLEPGSHLLKVKFYDNSLVQSEIIVKDSCANYELEILTPDVEHGSAVVMILPNNETLLIDCAKDWVRDSILIPFLHSNNITKLDHFIITHYHDDHDGGDKGRKIRELFNVRNFYDYKSFKTGDEFNIGDVKFKILNSYGDGNDENSNSLSLKMEYNGFIYQHGGDTYATNQNKILLKYPNDVKSDVFYANHHFHGSLYPEYIKAIDPKIIIVQAQEAIYSRGAYMDDFKKKAEKYLLSNSENYVECLPTLEVGTIVIKVNDLNNWNYETYPNKVIRDITSEQ